MADGHDMEGPPHGKPHNPAPLGPLVGRSVVGGILMGLANLVPGISGGTMLLAAGVYPAFITAVAEVTTIKLRQRSLVVLSAVVLSAMVAILLFAGPVKELVVHYRWVAYSLFIGLTLGGVPVVTRLLPRTSPTVWAGAAVGFLGMAGLAVVQALQAGTSGAIEASLPMMFVAGIAGASAMILPGVSGGYLLLVLGMYVPILAGIDALKGAMKALDPALMVGPLVTVVLPVGAGVVLGVAGVSNVLRFLLKRYEEAVLGVLLGLLVGAVVGLYPFQEGVPPAAGEVVKGREIAEGDVVDPEDWPVRFFAPEPLQVVGSLALVVVGFSLTLGVSVLGRRDEPA